MPDETEIKINLTGSIQDLANSQQYNTNPAGSSNFQTNTVMSNLTPNSVSQPNTGNQPFTSTQFVKLMDALATMTNRLETAHKRTHVLLEKMQLSLATRLESIYKQMMLMNKRSEEVNKRHLELQRQSEINTQDTLFKLSGFFGIMGEDFRKSVLRLQKFISTEDPAESARTSLIRLLGTAKFLRGFIGYEAEEFKGKMRPMPFTFELYQILLNMPKNFDTISHNIIEAEKWMQRGIQETRHLEIVGLFKIANDQLRTIVYIQHEFSKAMLDHFYTPSPLLSDMKRHMDIYFKFSEKSRTQYMNKWESKTDTQIEQMSQLKVAVTDKLGDLLKQTVSVGQGLFQISRYVFSPKSLFGKLFWGYMGYNVLAKTLQPLFTKIYAIGSPVVNAIGTAFSYLTKKILGRYGIEVKEGEKPLVVLKDTIVMALTKFWTDTAWPAIKTIAGSFLLYLTARNMGKNLRTTFSSKMVDQVNPELYKSVKTKGLRFSKKLHITPKVNAVLSTIMNIVGGTLESTGLIGVGEMGTAAKGFGAGMKRATRVKAAAAGGKGFLMTLAKGAGVAGKFLKFIPTLGAIAIGMSIIIPMLSSGLTFFRETLAPKLFGGEGNVPSTIRGLVGGTIKKVATLGGELIVTFIKNLPDNLKSLGNVTKQVLLGIWDAFVAMVKGMFKWIWENPPDALKGGPNSSSNIIYKQPPKLLPQSPEEAAREAKDDEKHSELVTSAEEQTSKLTEILEYFRGGKFREDMTKAAYTAGKTLKTMFEVIKDFAKLASGKFGDMMGAFSSTIGGFLAGLVGHDKTSQFLQKAQQLAIAKGRPGLARMFGRANESVMDIMTQNSIRDSVSSKTLAVAADNMLEASRTKSEIISNVPLQKMITLSMGKGTVTSGYGWRTIDGETKFHHGIDIAPLTKGQSIMAIASGEVLRAGRAGDYGNLVQVAYPQLGVSMLYGHLDKILVDPEQKVHPGTILGITGNTGESSGEHLHFEIRKLGSKKVVYPLTFANQMADTEGIFTYSGRAGTVYDQRMESSGAIRHKVGDSVMSFVEMAQKGSLQEALRMLDANEIQNEGMFAQWGGKEGTVVIINNINNAAQTTTSAPTVNNNNTTNSNDAGLAYAGREAGRVIKDYDLGLN